jgi:hypothetical protein
MHDNLWTLGLAAGFGMVFGMYFNTIWRETRLQVKKLRDAYEGKNKKAEKYVRWEMPPQTFNCRCRLEPADPSSGHFDGTKEIPHVSSETLDKAFRACDLMGLRGSHIHDCLVHLQHQKLVAWLNFTGPYGMLSGDYGLVNSLKAAHAWAHDLRDKLKEAHAVEAALRNKIKEMEIEKADQRAHQGGIQVLEAPTYHDVIVSVKGKDYRLFDHSYGLRLTCTRAGGWELWNMWGGKEELMGGEYAGLGPFSITVQGMTICQVEG